ncbi:HAD family hydrolase [Engelhardtia mirabilis]|uniref:Sulfotransferase family protein n=1 Tax=Engelhardtia mirabilis TaxID=2528011 RepID=A0A518BL94_9BACT|nr:hypothetical protein Pla133_28330 [Planctomycetes bacterium Pla133]QDV02070.1 hypothetical protein Pla86_28320 [Planctomycetes bacterium Pla86]
MTTPDATLRIAMWSGPRNISTALMRSFEARGDCAVVDEPLYAHYLDVTGLQHPGREQTLASQERDWRAVTDWLGGAVPGGKPVWYQKHMAHHLLPIVGRDWLDSLRHAFLVREPEAMLTSLIEVWPEPTLEDTGLPQQVELFERLTEEAGAIPAVVDSVELLRDPAGVLAQLCERLGLAYTERMLSWPAGPRSTDGVWAPHWYASVERSTGFAPVREKQARVPERLSGLLDRCRELYSRLAPHRLRATTAPLGGGAR